MLGLTFLIALLGLPLGFGAAQFKGQRIRRLALALVLLLPLLAISVALLVSVLRGLYDPDAVIAAFVLSLIAFGIQLILWAGLAAFGYSFGRRQARARFR